MDAAGAGVSAQLFKAENLMAVKLYPKSSNLQTDAFLAESTRKSMIQGDGFRTSENVARKAIQVLNTEIKPMVLGSKLNYTEAIKAAKKVNRKIYSRRFLMRFIGSVLILLAIVILSSSCQYTPSPNVYEAEGFSNSTTDGSERLVKSNITDNSSYKTPIVGIFHPQGNDEVANNGIADDNDELEYELTK